MVVPQGGGEATPLIVKLFMVFMCSQVFAEFCFFRDICDSCERAFDWRALLNIFVPLKIFSIFGKFLHPSKGLYCYIICSRNHKFSFVTVASFVTIAVLANLLFLRGG